MGQFAGSLFRMLLGWVQTAASWLWSLITDTDASTWLRWLMENWLLLLIIMCGVGLVIDFIVYLFRWQPYRMWGRSLHREADEEQPEENPPQGVYQRKWLYADGSTAVEEVHEPLQAAPAPVEEQLQSPVRPRRRMARRASPEQAYNQPVYPPQWQNNIQDQQGDNE